MPPSFPHEKLQAYQSALEFICWSETILERVPKTVAVHNQLDRARTSIPLNIAEGNGKFTAADRCRFFDTAHGSALECASCLDVLFAKRLVSEKEVEAGKTMLLTVVATLVGLIKKHEPARFEGLARNRSAVDERG